MAICPGPRRGNWHCVAPDIWGPRVWVQNCYGLKMILALCLLSWEDSSANLASVAGCPLHISSCKRRPHSLTRGQSLHLKLVSRVVGRQGKRALNMGGGYISLGSWQSNLYLLICKVLTELAFLTCYSWHIINWDDFRERLMKLNHSIQHVTRWWHSSLQSWLDSLKKEAFCVWILGKLFC